MYNGVGAPNANWTSEDYTRFRIAGFSSCLLMPYHTLEDVRLLRAYGCKHFVMRLPDSVDLTRWRGDVEYASMCIMLIKKFAQWGVKHYQLDNEPNLTWQEKDAPTWRWLLDRVATLIRQSPDVPGDVQLGLAPLAWNPSTWTSVQRSWIPQQRLIATQYQWASVHSYWQAAKHYNDPSFGGNATLWHDTLLPGMPQMITEWGNSIHETGLSAQDVEKLRSVQYPKWVEWVSGLPYVIANHLFICGGTDTWQGFWPSDKVLRAMAQADALLAA